MAELTPKDLKEMEELAKKMVTALTELETQATDSEKDAEAVEKALEKK